MKKPTGHHGPIRLGIDGPLYKQVILPQRKEEIELHFCQEFLKWAAKLGWLRADIDAIVPNPTDDLDFTIDTDKGRFYIELLEIAPLAGPYSADKGQYDQYDRILWIRDRIMEKSNKYKGATRTPIILLTYVTHWGFFVLPDTLAALRVLIEKEITCFHSVFNLEHANQQNVQVECIYPAPPNATRVEPETLRGKGVAVTNPEGWYSVDADADDSGGKWSGYCISVDDLNNLNNLGRRTPGS